jgi:hypothetical protein
MKLKKKIAYCTTQHNNILKRQREVVITSINVTSWFIRKLRFYMLFYLSRAPLHRPARASIGSSCFFTALYGLERRYSYSLEEAGA